VAAIGFLAMFAGGVIVWSGYLGETIPTVTKAILNGNTSLLTKQPLDPTKPRVAPVTSGGAGSSSGSGGGGGGSYQ